MGSIRGIKKRKKADDRDGQDASATPFDWWQHFSLRISGTLQYPFLFVIGHACVLFFYLVFHCISRLIVIIMIIWCRAKKLCAFW